MKKNQNDALISVIVSVYNVGPYLRKCLDSVLAQTYTNLQIIIVDDGSIDDSGEICDEYQQKDARIEVVHKENGGLVSARKRGLELAEGKYIGFVDGDDYIDAEFYSGMLKDIVENDVDFVHSASINEHGIKCEVSAKYEKGVHHIEGKQNDFIKKYMLNDNDETFFMYYGLQFKLFKAELIRFCYFSVPDTQSLGEDLLATCRCLMNSKKIYLNTVARYHYLVRQGSLCHRHDFESLKNQMFLYDNLLKVFDEYGIKEEMQEKVDELFQNRFVTLLAHLFQERHIHIYVFPNIRILRGKKVVIYCAGKVGQDYYAQLCKYRDIEVVAWADKNNKRYTFDYMEVLGREDIISLETDYILIATLSDQAAIEIRQELMDIGIDENKIIWEKPQKIHF